jgi:predicted nuclease of predicted toxin-antitoxin system
VSETIIFYADEHLPRPVCQGLRRRGIDLLTTQESGNLGASDVDQLAFATGQNRVLITFDTDLLVLH